MVKILSIAAIVLFTFIGIAAIIKQNPDKKAVTVSAVPPSAPIEIDLNNEVQIIELDKPTIIEAAIPPPLPAPPPLSAPVATPVEAKEEISSWPLSADDLPNDNRIEELFSTSANKLPIVETVTYRKKVDWHKGSPAWVSDYAAHYGTSRHFIARSLNGKADYLKQDVADGDRFNVLRSDKNIQFHLLVDISRCKMWFSYVDPDTKENVLLKSYDVGLGRVDERKKSGLLTPLGKFSLGNRIATYKAGMMGHHKGQKVEMMRIFGTRWIPFEKEIGPTTEPAKGFGIHGVPWRETGSSTKLVEDLNSLRHYESDGCIRMAAKDVEELYAIIVTKPTIVELVKDYYDGEFIKEQQE